MDLLTPVSLLKLAFGLYSAGFIAALLCIRRERLANIAGFGAAVLAGCAGAASGVQILLTPPALPPEFQLWSPAVPGLTLIVRLDSLSAFFLLVLSVLSVALSVYSLGYARGFYGRKSVGLLAALYNALLLFTQFVFTAANGYFFLLVWELMALAAYALVSFEHEHAETRKAGVLYFVMSHLGTGCLILGFLLLFQASGGYAFEGFRGIGNKMSEGQRTATFLLFLFGFGVKAGIVPLHIWLPAAHPVAPSNASALLSGVLIKTGIYGFARVFFEFLGAPPNWWGVTLLAIGTISAVLGVLYALMEHDLKRLLAYHSIENIGIILMGMGAALMFLHTGHPILASLALTAGLYHTINHALFKALLFLGAGAVLHSTGTRNMEDMGGLAKRMRWTALFFLIAAVAISALPPLNGFVSEWLTYQALLQGFGTTSSLIRLMFPFSGAMLALTGALAAACFVKAFGISFLAQPRSDHARRAHEASSPMLLGQAVLAVACIFLGLFPTFFLRVFDPLTRQMMGQEISAHLTAGNGLVLASGVAQGGTVSTLGIALILICLLPIPFALWLVFARKSKTRIAPTWDCGQLALTPQMEYTATGFSKPLRMIFKTLFRPRREIQREYDFSPYFATNIQFESHVEEVFQTRIYRPINRTVLRVSRRLRALQAGSVQAYLIYIFVTLLFLLMFAL